MAIDSKGIWTSENWVEFKNIRVFDNGVEIYNSNKEKSMEIQRNGDRRTVSLELNDCCSDMYMKGWRFVRQDRANDNITYYGGGWSKVPNKVWKDVTRECNIDCYGSIYHGPSQTLTHPYRRSMVDVGYGFELRKYIKIEKEVEEV